MSRPFQALPLINAVDHTIPMNLYKFPELVHEDDPATDIMIDFRRTPIATIDQNSSLDSAQQLVKNKHYDVLLITNKQQHLVGLLSAKYLLSSQPIQFMAKHRLQHDQTIAKMLMTPLDKVLQIDHSYLKHAKIGNVIETLREANKRYAIVVDTTTQHKTIIGIFAIQVINKHMTKQVHIEAWSHDMQSIAQMLHDDIG